MNDLQLLQEYVRSLFELKKNTKLMSYWKMGTKIDPSSKARKLAHSFIDDLQFDLGSKISKGQKRIITKFAMKIYPDLLRRARGNEEIAIDRLQNFLDLKFSVTQLPKFNDDKSNTW